VNFYTCQYCPFARQVSPLLLSVSRRAILFLARNYSSSRLLHHLYVLLRPFYQFMPLLLRSGALLLDMELNEPFTTLYSLVIIEVPSLALLLIHCRPD